jgi:hypothetical protein
VSENGGALLPFALLHKELRMRVVIHVPDSLFPAEYTLEGEIDVLVEKEVEYLLNRGSQDFKKGLLLCRELGIAVHEYYPESGNVGSQHKTNIQCPKAHPDIWNN